MTTGEEYQFIRHNFIRVVESIQQEAVRCQRDPAGIKLVVVTKGHPVEAVNEVLEAGAMILGENYVDEAVHKIDTLGVRRCQWHMIGHIQSRKANLVSQYFNFVHSLDSLKLAKRLSRFAQEQGRVIPVLVEFNVSGEHSKYGFPAWDQDHFNLVLEDIAQIVGLPGIQIQGLMTMPPFPEHPEDSRPYFKQLRKLQDNLNKRYPGCNWGELSMGMSGDYQVAIQEGATYLRIGTEIMGPRFT
jgi:pyridoxal phosphate enzyme (YggS family)